MSLFVEKAETTMKLIILDFYARSLTTFISFIYLFIFDKTGIMPV